MTLVAAGPKGLGTGNTDREGRRTWGGCKVQRGELGLLCVRHFLPAGPCLGTVALEPSEATLPNARPPDSMSYRTFSSKPAFSAHLICLLLLSPFREVVQT